MGDRAHRGLSIELGSCHDKCIHESLYYLLFYASRLLNLKSRRWIAQFVQLGFLSEIVINIAGGVCEGGECLGLRHSSPQSAGC